MKASTIENMMLTCAETLKKLDGNLPYMKEFEGIPESLRQHECPDWFRDLKFGIYFHWGPMSVPAVDGWYARNMYKQGSGAYKYHVKHYGHPSKVGYKDVIPLWKAEKFDPDKLVAYFKEVGAKYITPVAVHHDNFDLWNSKHHKWNAVNMGPKKDIIGMWKENIEKQGLIFGVTTHLSRCYSWFQTSHGADKTGSMKDVPYDGNDPEYEDFYLDTHDDDDLRSPNNPPEKWRRHWVDRITDLIDNYHPQLLYFDASVPFRGDDQGKTGMEVIAHFYNDNMKQTGGKSNGVLFIKKIPDHGEYQEGIASLDIEGHVSDVMLDDPWQTDFEIGQGWFYNRNAKYKSIETVIHNLVKIISMNGNLLLNIPIMPDGTLDADSKRVLEGVKEWLSVNGDAVFKTRPWKQSHENGIYFTRKGKNLYLFALKKLKKKISIKALGSKNLGVKIARVVLMESKKEVTFRHEENALHLEVPKQKFTKHVVVIHLHLE
ncbi:MAG: alpha-L-fucosidase [Candidatus Hodarchaeota archaeon]